MQGRTQEFERGGGGASLSHARRGTGSLKVITSVLEKKRLSRQPMSNFSPHVKRRAKKSFLALKLSFVRISLLHRESWGADPAASP